MTDHVAIAPVLFLTDHLDIGKDLAAAAGGGSPAGGLMLLLGGPRAGFALDASRSYYVSTKALPDNDEITVNLTFNGSGDLQTVPDTHGTPIKVHYSILEEPARTAQFVPRPADDRIGYFLETQKHFGDDRTPSPFVRYIDRWDLSKGPIVFTMTNEVPREYRDAVRRGILAWNAAFAKIGYPHAIRVDDPPADPSFDPDDAKYNSVRWIDQDRASSWLQRRTSPIRSRAGSCARPSRSTVKRCAACAGDSSTTSYHRAFRSPHTHRMHRSSLIRA